MSFTQSLNYTATLTSSPPFYLAKILHEHNHPVSLKPFILPLVRVAA